MSIRVTTVLFFLIVLGRQPLFAAPAPAWNFEVKVAPSLEQLSVDTRLRAPIPRELSVASGAEPFVRDVQVETARGWKALQESGGSWFLPSGQEPREWHLRYRFMLRKAGTALADPETATVHGDIVQTSPTCWLLHPLGVDSSKPYRFHVSCPPPARFVSGVWPVAGQADTYQAEISQIYQAPASAFGKLHLESLHSGGGTVDLAFAPGGLNMSDAQVVDWVRFTADAISRFYGRYPVSRVLILILPEFKGGIYGETLGNGGASILLLPPAMMPAEELRRTWQLTHEMVHLALPSVPRRYHWIEEGLATYIEPLVRVRVGDLTPEKVWGDMVEGLPQGEPGPGDRGLDITHTWGRTYWGGCLFCFLADLEIREKTNNRLCLDDALRGILKAGGNITFEWPLSKVLEVGDKAVGLHVLEDLHARMGPSPVQVDLDAIWRRLGIQMKDGKVTFTTAPFSAIRDAMAARYK